MFVTVLRGQRDTIALTLFHAVLVKKYLALRFIEEPLASPCIHSLKITCEGYAMSDQKQDPQQTEVPAHSTEEEKARLKDKNKDGIPPGAE